MKKKHLVKKINKEIKDLEKDEKELRGMKEKGEELLPHIPGYTDSAINFTIGGISELKWVLDEIKYKEIKEKMKKENKEWKQGQTF